MDKEYVKLKEKLLKDAEEKGKRVCKNKRKIVGS
jgi:hypothetical protein